MKRIIVAGLALALPACTDLNSGATPDQTLVLTASPRAIAADGFSTATIVAEISSRADERFRDITFKTTLGSFPAGTSPKATTIVVAADTSGRAVVTLQSGTVVGTATVTAEVLEGEAVKVSRTIDLQFERVAASTVLTLELGSVEAPADGATVTNILARIAPSVPTDQRTVTFTTTLGSLDAPNVTSRQVFAGADDAARVGLVSPRETGTALVTAALNGLSVRGAVTFEAALPDSASLRVLGSFKIAASFATKVALSVQLFRDVGTVTKGTEILFSATDDSTGNAFGYFSAVTPSDATGAATAEFTPGNTTERGNATFQAKVKGSNVAATVKVEIVDPTP